MSDDKSASGAHREALPVSTQRLEGGYGRYYVQTRVGGVTVQVYESEVRENGVTVEIDLEDGAGHEIAVYIHDELVAEGPFDVDDQTTTRSPEQTEDHKLHAEEA